MLTGVIEVFKSLESAWVEISAMRAADSQAPSQPLKDSVADVPPQPQPRIGETLDHNRV
jgi:hypothetical protein